MILVILFDASLAVDNAGSNPLGICKQMNLQWRNFRQLNSLKQVFYVILQYNDWWLTRSTRTGQVNIPITHWNQSGGGFNIFQCGKEIKSLL